MSKFNELSAAFVGMRSELARSILKIVPPDTVEDIVQETYVKLCQQSSDTDIKYPRAYFYRAVKNLALDHVRRFDQRFTDPLEEEADLPEGANAAGIEVMMSKDGATWKRKIRV